jgi:hypothetical protein
MHGAIPPLSPASYWLRTGTALPFSLNTEGRNASILWHYERAVDLARIFRTVQTPQVRTVAFWTFCLVGSDAVWLFWWKLLPSREGNPLTTYIPPSSQNIDKFGETVGLLHLCLFQYHVSTKVKISTEIQTAATRCLIEHLYVEGNSSCFALFQVW